MLITLFISILLSIGSHLSTANIQEFFWVPQKMVLTSISQQLFIFGEDKLAVLDPETLKILKTQELNLDSHLSKQFLRLKFFEWQNQLVGVHQGNGRIYQLQDSSFIRIDRSKIEKGLHDGFSFQHQDTLFRYGGYGFWKASHQLIYFDQNTREWEVYPIQKSSSIPPAQFSITGHYSNGFLYTFKGRGVDARNPKENTGIEDFWSFNFQEKTWTKVDKGNALTSLVFVNTNTRIPSPEYLYLQSNSKIVKIDPDASRYETYEPNPLFFRAVNRSDLLSFDQTHAYFVTLSTNGFKIDKSPLKLFLSRPLESGSYLRDWRLYYAGIGLIIVSLTLIYFRWSRRKKQFVFIHLSPQEVRYKTQRFEVSPQQYNVLFELKDHKEVLASRIKDLVHNPELSNAQNERNKLLMIQNLNQEFKRLIGKAIISEEKSSLDKRIKLYTLDREIKIMIKNN